MEEGTCVISFATPGTDSSANKTILDLSQVPGWTGSTGGKTIDIHHCESYNFSTMIFGLSLWFDSLDELLVYIVNVETETSYIVPNLSLSSK